VAVTPAAAPVPAPVTLLVGPGGSAAPSYNATRHIELESLRIEESGNRESATLEVDVFDRSLSLLNSIIGPEGKVLCKINNQQVFLGYVRQPRAVWTGISRRITLQAYDIGALLDKLIVYPSVKRPGASERDKARIQYLLNTFGQPFLNDGSSDFSKIQTLATDQLDAQRFANMTLRQAIEQVLGMASRSSNYFVDALGRLHTFDNDFPETDTAPYDINVATTPGAGAVAPDDLDIEWDTTNLVNFWVVRGKNAAGSGAFSDSDSIQTYGLRQSYIDAPDSTKVAQATRVGNAALRDTKDPVPRGTFSVFGPRSYNGTARWMAGQKVTITSAAHGITARVYRITRNTITLLDGTGNLRNEIEFGGNKRPFRSGGASGASIALAGASLLAISGASVNGSIGDDQNTALRLVDSSTGAGILTTNTDPNNVGVDPVTGADAPVGTDVGFGSMFRRLVHTNVINGDFGVAPPSGAYSGSGDPTPYLIDSDSGSATYNPLPGWTWTPSTTSPQTAWIETTATAGSGSVFHSTKADPLTGAGILAQLIPVPASKGQQYRVLLSSYIQADIGSGSTPDISYRFYRADATTAIGSVVTKQTNAGSAVETKVDVGLVPENAGYLFVYLTLPANDAFTIQEVRAAFLPAEASLGLKSNAAALGAITTTQTRVVGITVPAGSFTVGSTYRLTGYGVITSTVANAVTFRVRCGPTTLTGNIAGSRAPNATTTASADGFKVEFLFTVRSVGGSGSCIANGTTEGGPSQPFNTNSFVSGTTATVAVDTTVANELELTCVTAAGTTSVRFHQALIECVMAS